MEYNEYINNEDITNYITSIINKSFFPTFFDKFHPIIEELEINYISILNEFLNVEKKSHDWLEKDIYYTKDKNFQVGKGWNVFGLWEFGIKNQKNCNLCPLTSSIFEKYNDVQSIVAFSILRKKSHIIPHHGWFPYSNLHLRGHLGLIIPDNNLIKTRSIFPEIEPFSPSLEFIPNCAIKVKDDIKTWETGKVLIFDDINRHSAWNFTDIDRVVLLFDLPKADEYKLKIDEKYLDPKIMEKYFSNFIKKIN